MSDVNKSDAPGDIPSPATTLDSTENNSEEGSQDGRNSRDEPPVAVIDVNTDQEVAAAESLRLKTEGNA